MAMEKMQPNERRAGVEFIGRCPHCGKQLDSMVFCSSCRTLVDLPPGTDHFALLGLPRGYDLDPARLQTAYRALSRSIHPDRFAAESDNTRALAVAISAAINEAYDVLRDPVRRADHLLTLAGGPSAMEERGVPGSLLTDVLTLREEIDAARESDDRTTLQRIQGELTERRREAMAVVARQAEALEQATPEGRKELRRQLNSMKYLDNLWAQTQDEAPVQTL